MRNVFMKLHVKAQVVLASLKKDESGQDLIEYALVVALVAFAATAGMSSLATGINTAFTNIAGILGTYIT
jgi:pilus assembly protein Flp/PilA